MNGADAVSCGDAIRVLSACLIVDGKKTMNLILALL
jgi:hypothetical protein